MISKLALFIVVLQSTGAILTRFGLVLHTSLYSCNFLCERRIEIKFLPISSTVYFAPEELDFVSVRLKSFQSVQLNLCTVAGLFRLLKICCHQPLASGALTRGRLKTGTVVSEIVCCTRWYLFQSCARLCF